MSVAAEPVPLVRITGERRLDPLLPQRHVHLLGLRDRDVVVVLAIQGAGAIPRASFKWLMADFGLGFLYVRRAYLPFERAGIRIRQWKTCSELPTPRSRRALATAAIRCGPTTTLES